MSKEKEINANVKLISIENLSKVFSVKNRRRDILKEVTGYKKEQYKRITAVNDVSFDLWKGETLGIVGRNGSGKSTLLQLLCGIINPSSGKVDIRGRIAALLELGSGFNPEFTGRENIYLNGTLLGLRKKEIDERIESIIEFSEIEEYIDQPVKQYSSGMLVRLAFSVITNVDADILVIDEALAVGDAYFNQKCMRFFRRFKRRGSLVFVSHDANAIIDLCDRAILLDKGKMVSTGRPKYVIDEYTKRVREEIKIKNMEEEDEAYIRDTEGEIIGSEERNRWRDYRTEAINRSEMKNKIKINNINDRNEEWENIKSEKAEIITIEIKNEESKESLNYILGGEVVELAIKVRAHEKLQDIICGFLLKNERGQTLLGDNTLNDLTTGKDRNTVTGSIVKARFIFTMPLLPKGKYSVGISIACGTQESHDILIWENEAMLLESTCNSIATGLAGVPMHSITQDIE